MHHGGVPGVSFGPNPLSLPEEAFEPFGRQRYAADPNRDHVIGDTIFICRQVGVYGRKVIAPRFQVHMRGRSPSLKRKGGQEAGSLERTSLN